ncbi:hypothetical protein PHAVU_009G158400 [Phaseolus vulgaris]|uniref:Uncharacterized protein n=1 Tax=Phaseolus vulgaris TaxID=3885 RepID=V7AYY4_PHAVU|nr:hypothetical protein PHAVU_009G158400g [Phaseolus vulgaris]ESW09813.1 hypothetical protein PHAVU_009G158400g [Phaseolus vulgaris]
MTPCSLFSRVINNSSLRSATTLVVFTFGVVPCCSCCYCLPSGFNVPACHPPQSLPLVG